MGLTVLRNVYLLKRNKFYLFILSIMKLKVVKEIVQNMKSYLSYFLV